MYHIYTCRRRPNEHHSPKGTNYRTKYFKFLPGEESHHGPWVSLDVTAEYTKNSGPTLLFTQSHFSWLCLQNNFEKWGNVLTWVKSGLVSTHRKSSGSQSSWFHYCNATHWGYRHLSGPFILSTMGIGGPGEPKQMNIKLWILFILWVIKLFVFGTGVLHILLRSKKQ